MKKIKSGERRKQQNKILVLVAIVLVIIGVLGFRNELVTREYQIKSEKISSEVRIAFVSDLHSCYYGKNQKELIDNIQKINPDIVLLGGDIFDDKLDSENATLFLERISKKYICYYVSGNHEYWSGNIDGIKEIVEEYGIEVLEGENYSITVNGQKISICGIDDSEIGIAEYEKQIIATASDLNSSDYNIFMAHRPEYIETYLNYDFDLILSGHAHGGQWRIPGLINGLLSPNQGMFPKYAGGEYRFDNKEFIVSRGLAKESTRVPRIFNPTEVVAINIEPKGINK